MIDGKCKKYDSTPTKIDFDKILSLTCAASSCSPSSLSLPCQASCTGALTSSTANNGFDVKDKNGAKTCVISGYVDNCV